MTGALPHLTHPRNVSWIRSRHLPEPVSVNLYTNGSTSGVISTTHGWWINVRFSRMSFDKIWVVVVTANTKGYNSNRIKMRRVKQLNSWLWERISFIYGRRSFNGKDDHNTTIALLSQTKCGIQILTHGLHLEDKVPMRISISKLKEKIATIRSGPRLNFGSWQLVSSHSIQYWSGVNLDRGPT